jgi:hypothetical protein
MTATLRREAAASPAPHRDPSAALSGPQSAPSWAAVVLHAALIGIARFAGRVPGWWPRSRTTALTLAAFSCFTVAAWVIAVPFGLAVAGLALLAFEALGGPD